MLFSILGPLSAAYRREEREVACRIAFLTMALLSRWRRLEGRLPSITSNRLRVMNKWLFFLWIFPGIPVSIYLRSSIGWVVFLSVYAIIVAHLIEWRQEDGPAAD